MRQPQYRAVMTSDRKGKSVPLTILAGKSMQLRIPVYSLDPRGFSGEDLRRMRATGQARECARRLARMG